MDASASRSPRFAGWVAGIAVAVMVVLAPLVAVQYRQYQQMRVNVEFETVSSEWHAFQLQLEHMRLRTAMKEALSERPTANLAPVQLRFDVFVSRVATLEDSKLVQMLHDAPQYRATMAMLREFIQRADPVFSQSPAGGVAATTLQSLLDETARHEAALHDLAQLATTATYAYIDQRNQTIRQQALLVIGLAALQALVLLIFVGLLILYIQRQYRNNMALQDLATHLRTARAEAEAANQGKTLFVANMSHEIRTPFQGLLGMLNLLDESSLTGKQRDYVQTARDSAQHLLGILNDILDVSTMESGTLRLVPAPVRLSEVLSDVHSLMHIAAIDKGLDLDLIQAPGLPQWVVADATRVRQILFNLINNAIKFTDAGRVTVTARPRPGGAPGIEIDIADTGIGMDEQTVKNLFARFYQADASIRRRYGGTGLGLEISRTLARMMGGEVTVTSQPGVGSCFKVVLPLEDASEQAIPVNDLLPSDRKLRVLVAEDHPINLKYLSILLERMGHDAAFCENGAEAVELVRHGQFDVVLMDLHMPVMDGLSATRAIRALDGPASQVKIVLVTADVVNDTRDQALQADVNAFAAKPLQANDLVRAFRHCGLLSGDSPVVAVSSTPFVVSDYDAPVELPAIPEPPVAPPVVYVDGPTFREVVGMMPEDTLRDLMDELFNAPHGAIKGLLAELAGSDRQAIGAAAHKLKGTSMLLGLKAIVKTTAALEHTARKTDDPIPPDTAALLEQDIRNTRETLEALGMRLGSGAG